MNNIPKSSRFLIKAQRPNINNICLMRTDETKSFRIESGRLGNIAVGYSPITYWDATYATYIRKGYADISDLYFSGNGLPSVYGVNELTAAERLLIRLLKAEDSHLEIPYITDTMFEKAYGILNEMKLMPRPQGGNKADFNDLLRAILTYAPQIYRRTEKPFVDVNIEIPWTILMEEATLDYARAIRYRKTKDGSVVPGIRALMESSHLALWEDNEHEKLYNWRLNDDRFRISRSWRVENVDTRKTFMEYADTLRNYYAKDDEKVTISRYYIGVPKNRLASILLHGFTECHLNMDDEYFYALPPSIRLKTSLDDALPYTDFRDENLDYLSYQGRHSDDNDKETGYILAVDVAMLDAHRIEEEADIDRWKTDIARNMIRPLYISEDISYSYMTTPSLIVFNPKAITVTGLAEIVVS